MSIIEPGDIEFKLVQRGLYVKKPKHKITLDTVAQDGNQFIYLQRLQNDRDDQIDASQALGRKKISEYNILRKKFHADKKALTERFPKQIEVPGDSEEEWCMFCLGSELCSTIYKNKTSCNTSGNLIEGHLPLLSIFLHFSQETLMLLLEYHYSWFLIIGMHEDLCMWMYALFVCLENSCNEEYKEILEVFHNDCLKHLKKCDSSELNITALISLILSSFFSK